MQIRDSFIYDDKEFDIFFTEHKLPFDPKNLGLRAEDQFTGCYRGYMSVYSILEGKLILKDLYIFSEEPRIANGIIPIKPERYTIFPYIYKGLNIVINYTGAILIAGDYIRKYDSETREYFPYYYKVVHALYFEEGKILKSIEYSKFGEEIRAYKISEKNNSEEAIYIRRKTQYEFMISFLPEEYKNKWIYNKCYYHI